MRAAWRRVTGSPGPPNRRESAPRARLGVIGGKPEPAAIELCARDVLRITVPTPWMGTVNAYLLTGDPLTLVDAGPGLTSSTVMLCRAIRGAGYDAREIELLIATHHHFDHMGAMQHIAGLSGAEVLIHRDAAPFVIDWERSREGEDDWLAGQMIRHGVPPMTARAARQFARLEAHLAEPLDVSRRLLDGDVVRAGGREFHVLFRPGHSPSDIVLFDAREGLLLSGDHLLADVSSNALMALPLHGGGPESPRPHALVDYRRSLAATWELPARLVLPGHGSIVGEHRLLIDQRIAEQDRRARHLGDRLRRTPRSAFALASEIWGSEANAQVFLVLSEVLGHLDLLLDDGVAEIAGPDSSLFQWI
jgi:glyoxylase-like metal-dependent hydrolase (beta-lactamase superfamily II)